MWVYNVPDLLLALLFVAGIETIALVGLALARRFVQPRLRYHDGVNDAVSGTVQAIGVFYGITVGLIAVGVWTTYSNASDLVSLEAAAIGSLYRVLNSFPEPARTELRTQLRDYTLAIIGQDWPAQRQGQVSNASALILDKFEATLMSVEPVSVGQQARYAETLSAFDRLNLQRRLRIDAVEGGLSGVMWGVIWIGAAISIGVGYFFYIEDVKLHAIMISLMAGFLGIVLFLIVVNDRPFEGDYSINASSYQLIVDTVMNVSQ